MHLEFLVFFRRWEVANGFVRVSMQFDQVLLLLERDYIPVVIPLKNVLELIELFFLHGSSL